MRGSAGENQQDQPFPYTNIVDLLFLFIFKYPLSDAYYILIFQVSPALLF